MKINVGRIQKGAHIQILHKNLISLQNSTWFVLFCNKKKKKSLGKYVKDQLFIITQLVGLALTFPSSFSFRLPTKYYKAPFDNAQQEQT